MAVPAYQPCGAISLHLYEGSGRWKYCKLVGNDGKFDEYELPLRWGISSYNTVYLV